MDKQNVDFAATSSTNLKSLNYNERLKWYHNKITAAFLTDNRFFVEKEQLLKIMILTFFPMFLWTEFPEVFFFLFLVVWNNANSFSPLTKIIYHYNWFCLLIILISISNHVFDRLGLPKNFFPNNLKKNLVKV